MIKPTVHVLMPVYNAMQYIEKSIRSICQQDYPNITIIVYDDGSTDESIKIVHNYMNKNAPQKKYKITRETQNRGEAHARQRLLQYSKELNSEAYIFWLDTDDQYADSTFISEAINQMLKTNADICLFNFSLVYEDTNQLKNSAGLPQHKTKVDELLDFIQNSAEKCITFSQYPDIMNFTSLGWTKGYSPKVVFPKTAPYPFVDMSYMALFLCYPNYRITGLPSNKKPVLYLRRANSICGQRKPENFTLHIPAQLEMFFSDFLEFSYPSHEIDTRFTAVIDFVNRKTEQYQKILSSLVDDLAYPHITQDTLNEYKKVTTLLKLRISQEYVKRVPSIMRP